MRNTYPYAPKLMHAQRHAQKPNRHTDGVVGYHRQIFSSHLYKFVFRELSVSTPAIARRLVQVQRFLCVFVHDIGL